MVTKRIEKIDDDTIDIIWRYTKTEILAQKQKIENKITSEKGQIDDRKQTTLDDINDTLSEFDKVITPK